MFHCVTELTALFIGIYFTLALYALGYTVYIQELSDEMDVQVVPSSLFVSVPGQDKRIPYCRPAKHFLSLER